MARIARSEGRQLFGLDPASYDLGRPGHPARVYEVLVERCGLGSTARVLEVGPGTGQATRELLDRGASVVAVEPDESLAQHLESTFGGRVDVLRTTLEDAVLASAAFGLAVAASSFHWVDEPTGLGVVHHALEPDGWIGLWWTLFGEGGNPDAFIDATAPLLEGLATSPTKGREDRPAHGLDEEARSGALRAAGFADVRHESPLGGDLGLGRHPRALRQLLTHPRAGRRRPIGDPRRDRAHRGGRLRRPREPDGHDLALHGAQAVLNDAAVQ